MGNLSEELPVDTTLSDTHEREEDAESTQTNTTVTGSSKKSLIRCNRKSRKQIHKHRKLERKRVMATEGNTECDLRPPKRPLSYYDIVNVKNKSNWSKSSK